MHIAIVVDTLLAEAVAETLVVYGGRLDRETVAAEPVVLWDDDTVIDRLSGKEPQRAARRQASVAA